MKKRLPLFFILLSLSLALFGQDNFMEEFRQKWQNASEYTVELAKLMPSEYFDYTPVEEVKPFSNQLLHMTRNMIWLSTSYISDKHFEQKTELENPGKEEIIRLLEESFSFTLKAIEEFSSDQLEEKVEFFAGPMSKRQILILMNDHLTHHRGQLIVYLRMKGIKPPAYRGW